MIVQNAPASAGAFALGGWDRMSERVKIVLACEVCESRNYKTTKKRVVGEQKRLELKKFCPSCNKHTIHRETR